MTISLFGAVVALLLLIIPFYAFYALGIKFSSRLLVAVARMLIGLGVAGMIMKVAMLADNVVATLGLSLLLTVAASFIAVARSRQKMSSCLLPIMAGMGIAALVVVAFLALMVISGPQITSPAVLISVVALVAGGCIVPVSDGLTAYYAGLRHHASLFNYLVGNGSTRQEALNYLLKRAVQRASAPLIRYIGGMMVASQPLMMWAMMAAGTPLYTAMAWQAVMALAIVSASVGAVMFSLLLARHFSIDDYSRIKD